MIPVGTRVTLALDWDGVAKAGELTGTVIDHDKRFEERAVVSTGKGCSYIAPHDGYWLDLDALPDKGHDNNTGGVTRTNEI